MLRNKILAVATSALILGGVLQPAAAFAAPTHPAVVVAKTSDYAQASAVVKAWPKHPYSSLNADGREEYTKAYITKTLAGAKVTPVKGTWEKTGKNSAKLVTRTVFKDGHKSDYYMDMTKEHGVWKIGYTIYKF